MRKFVVPQFIDIESKILGPITVRQFSTIAVGSVLVFVAYKLSDFTLFLLWLVIILILVFVFGFLKINGQPFYLFMINFIGSLRKPALRIWRKQIELPSKDSGNTKKKQGKDEYVFIPKKKLSSENLSELALIIDTGGVYKGEAEANRIYKTAYEKTKKSG